jgi:Transposase IS116/IS110/IS902 family
VLAYTIAAELGDINRFPSPRKLAGHSGLCPRVYQPGERDLRGPLAKQGPRYLRWALVEAATHPCTHPAYRARYQRTKTRVGKQRGAKVTQIDLAPPARRGDLADAHPRPTLRSQRRHRPPGRLTVPKEMRHRSELRSSLVLPRGGDREMSAARHPQRPRPP